MTEALTRAGRDLTREGLIAAIETFEDYEGLSLVTFTKDNHVGLTKGWIRQLQNGAFVKVSDYIDTDY